MSPLNHSPKRTSYLRLSFVGAEMRAFRHRLVHALADWHSPDSRSFQVRFLAADRVVRVESLRILHVSASDIAARRVELLLVVIPEPMETRTLGDLAYLCGAGERGRECPAGESRHNSS